MSCVAVGALPKSSTSAFALAAGLSGSKWTLQKAVEPAKSKAGYLLGVTCTGVKQCLAVGYYEKGSFSYPLAERWNGAKWALETVPAPAGSPATYLSAVSCAGTKSCFAVGYSMTPRYTPFAFSASWDGSKWVDVSTPSPTGAGKSFLNGAACPTAKACLSVGYYVSANGVELPLIETWNGAKLALGSAPVPSGASATILNAISCISAAVCAAVADYVPAKKQQSADLTAAELWIGQKWTVRPVSEPAGATAGHLDWISCSAAETCTAVGQYSDAKSAGLSLAEGWNGTKWTAQPTPDPSGKASGLLGVSCASARDCSATGAYVRSGAAYVTFAEAWNGAKWTVQSTPN